MIVSTCNQEVAHCDECDLWWLMPQEADAMMNHENTVHGPIGVFCLVTWYRTPFVFPRDGTTLSEMESREHPPRSGEPLWRR